MGPQVNQREKNRKKRKRKKGSRSRPLRCHRRSGPLTGGTVRFVGIQLHLRKVALEFERVDLIFKHLVCRKVPEQTRDSQGNECGCGYHENTLSSAEVRRAVSGMMNQATIYIETATELVRSERLSRQGKVGIYARGNADAGKNEPSFHANIIGAVPLPEHERYGGREDDPETGRDSGAETSGTSPPALGWNFSEIGLWASTRSQKVIVQQRWRRAHIADGTSSAATKDNTSDQSVIAKRAGIFQERLTCLCKYSADGDKNSLSQGR